MAFYSPLRYPGGKGALMPFLSMVIKANNLHGGVYAEPYAGGAGAALGLLYGKHVNSILINDADYCVYSFWQSILHNTSRFLRILKETPITIKEWEKQREIYRTPKRHTMIRIGFACFYLNRCNRSGILLKAGPIGGKDQAGKWKINARFNKKTLRDRIGKIAFYRDRIRVSNMDAIDFIRNIVAESGEAQRTLVYLDPPYYVQGAELYLNHYKHEDHVQLARYMRQQHPFKWIMSYDNVKEISALYFNMNRIRFKISYSANTTKNGSELLIYDNYLQVPLPSGILHKARRIAV